MHCTPLGTSSQRPERLGGNVLHALLSVRLYGDQSPQPCKTSSSPSGLKAHARFSALQISFVYFPLYTTPPQLIDSLQTDDMRCPSFILVPNLNTKVCVESRTEEVPFNNCMPHRHRAYKNTTTITETIRIMLTEAARSSRCHSKELTD